jgi:2-phosphosulfolactate phosphatase
VTAVGTVVVDLSPAPGAAPRDLRDWTGVAVDVLRATTTLTVARGNGAARVVPFSDTSAAIAWRDAHPGALACGERDGRIVPGFDCGNSPAEYPRERVEGRALAFASTNGSRAMLALAGCRRRVLAAFVNASDAVRALAGEERVRIACAGKEGAFALEDAACAGWLVRGLVEAGGRPGNDAARFVASIAPRDAGEVRAMVEGCDHARYLASLGPEFVRDVAFCGTLDAVPGVHAF